MSNRGPIEYTSVASPLTFTPPILWIQVISAGSGGLVVKDEGGTTRTYTGLSATDPPLVGPFREITSMTLSKIRVGDSVPVPPAAPTSSLLGSTSAGNGAALVAIADAGSFTAQTTVEGALQEVYQSLESSQGAIDLAPSRFYLLTGAPLAVFANGASAVPGSAIVDSKAFAIRWNNNSTLNGVMTSFIMPPDCDITANMTLTIYASKTGATSGDAVTFDVGAFNQVVGALHDADSDFGGTTGAMTGAATAKTVQAVTLTLALANLAASPAGVTLTIKPTDGTLGTDDLVFLGARVTYKKKILTS